MTFLAIVLIVAVAAMWLFVNKIRGARQADGQSRDFSKGEGAAESSKLTQKHRGVGRGVQSSQTPTPLSNASPPSVRESQKKGESAKRNQATSLSPEDVLQHENRNQLLIDGEEQRLNFNEFEECGQENVVPRSTPRTPKTAPNLSGQRGQGVRKPGKDTTRNGPSGNRSRKMNEYEDSILFGELRRSRRRPAPRREPRLYSSQPILDPSYLRKRENSGGYSRLYGRDSAY